MRKAPLVAPALALMAGIGLARMVPGIGPWAWIVAAAALALATGVWLLWRGVQRGVWVPVVALFVALGGLRERGADPLLRPDHYSHLASGHRFVALRLTETPAPAGRTLRARAEVMRVDGQPACGTMRLYLRPDSAARALRLADSLLLHAYPDFGQGRVYTSSDHFIIQGRDSTSLRARAEALRQRLLSRMRGGPLGGTRLGVAEALALGWRADLDADLWQRWRRAGIVHVLCLSGLHVGLLAGLVGGALRLAGRLRRGRAVRGAVQLLAVWGLAIVSGCAPATARAALMFSLFIIADIAGRRTPRLNLLALAAIITLLARPALLFDVGWQLSYAAVGGILLAMPLVRLWRNALWQGAAVSTAAQVATLPIAVHTFHTVPTAFLLANLALIPLATVLLVAALAYMACPCAPTAWAAGAVVDVVDGVSAWVAARPWAMAEGVHPGPAGMALLVAAVLALLLGVGPLLRRFDGSGLAR